MKLHSPNLFLEQIITQLKDGREYSQLPARENKSCILIAFENEEYEAAEFLIAKMAINISPSVMDKENWLAFSSKHKSSILNEKIISLGADINKITKPYQLDPIVYAILDNNHSLLNKIVKTNKTFTQDELDGYFHLACQKGAFNCLATLQERGANINSIGITGNTPLLSAIENEQYITATRLIDLKANVNVKNTQDVTPLILATSKRMPGLVAELVAENADVNHIPYLGNSALMISSRFGDKEIIKELFKQKIDPEIKNCNDQSAMEIAVEFKQKEIVKLLKENGVKCNNLPFIVKSNIDSIREKVFGSKKDNNTPN